MALEQRKLLPAGPAVASIATPNAHTREPLRVPRACVGCRKQKTKCIQGEPEAHPCKRCRVYSLQCTYEDLTPSISVICSRVDDLEAEVARLRQLEGEVATLRLVLSSIPQNPTPMRPALQASHPSTAHQLNDDSSRLGNMVNGSTSFQHQHQHHHQNQHQRRQDLMNSANVSEDEDDEDALPRHALTAPIETLNRLADRETTREDGVTDGNSKPKKRSRSTYETMDSQFRDIDIIQRGIVTEQEARELHRLYFTGSYRVLACFDPSFDTFESMRTRSPFLLAAVCMVGSRVKDAGRSPSAKQVQLRTEVETLAKEALFRRVTGLEVIQAMLLTAGWSANGFLCGGLALRMALELGIQKAFRRLASRRTAQANLAKERPLVAAARLFCCLFVLDWQSSIGADRPVMLRQEQEHSVPDLRSLLEHPLSVSTDTRLVSTCELMVLQARLTDSLRAHDPEDGRTTSNMLQDAQRQVSNWHSEWSRIMEGQCHGNGGFFQRSLAIQLNYTNLFHASLVLRGLHSNIRPSPDMEKVIKFAVESACACVRICVEEGDYRDGLRFAVDYTLGAAAFAGAFLLRFARLVPRVIDPHTCINLVEALIGVLSSVPGTRFVHSLENMVERARSRLSFNDIPQVTSMSSLVGSNHDVSTPSLASEDLDWLKFLGSGLDQTALPEEGSGVSPIWWNAETNNGIAEWSLDLNGFM